MNNSTPFELKTASRYNNSTLYDKIMYNYIIIAKCQRIGKNTQILEEFIRRQILLYSDKIKKEHCNM